MYTCTHLVTSTRLHTRTHAHTRGLRTRRCLGPRGARAVAALPVRGSPPREAPPRAARGAFRAREEQGLGTAGLRFTRAAPCPAPEARPGEAAGGRAGGEERLRGLYLPNQVFVLYFASRGALCAEGGATRRLRDWSVRHHCPSVPCVLCQAPPRHHHQHLPLSLPLPARQVSSPLPRGSPSRLLSVALAGGAVTPGPSVTLQDGWQGPAVQLGLRSGGPAHRDLRVSPA